MVIEILSAGGLMAGALRVGLMVRPVGRKQKTPAQLGHPMAGPASRASAHVALSRQRPANRPKFRT